MDRLFISDLFLEIYQIGLGLIFVISLIASFLLIRTGKKRLGASLLVAIFAVIIPLVSIPIFSTTNESLRILNNTASFAGIFAIVLYIISMKHLMKSRGKISRVVGYIQLILISIAVIGLFMDFIFTVY